MNPSNFIKLFNISILLVIICGKTSVSAIDERQVTKIINSLFENGYDKRIRPNYGGRPVTVGITMHIISVSSVSERQMDFTSDFYFRQMWNDHRLSFAPQNGINELVLTEDAAQNIWIPDTFFPNEKSATFHTIPTPNTFVRIKSNGDVFKSIRLTLTASCPMNLQYFPMDRQLCTIEMESYGFSMADIVYQWGRGPGSVGMSAGLELPQFKVVGHRQAIKVEMLSNGNYSRLFCEIQFVRSLGYYVIQIYMPAALMVITSWISFWFGRKSGSERVIIGMVTLAILVGLNYQTNLSAAKISYIKITDVYLGFCLFLVICSLLVHATVRYLNKGIAINGKQQSNQTDIRLKLISGENPSLEENQENLTSHYYNIRRYLGYSPSHIDRYSRIGFPIIFIVFNIIYWSHYLKVSDVLARDLITLH